MRKSRLSTSDASIDNHRPSDCQPLSYAQRRRVRAVTMALRGGEFEPGDRFKLMDPSGSCLASYNSGVTGVVIARFERIHNGSKRYLVHFDDEKLNPKPRQGTGELFEGKRYFWVREPDIQFICAEDE